MGFIDKLSEYTIYRKADDVINLLGEFVDESKVISDNYTDKYINDIYTPESYISSKIFNYDKVNKPIYTIDLGVVLSNTISTDSIIIPKYSTYVSQDQTSYTSMHSLLLNEFSQIMRLEVVRGVIQSRTIDASEVLNSQGFYNLSIVDGANYLVGSLTVDGVEYAYDEYAPYQSNSIGYSVTSVPTGDNLTLNFGADLLRMVSPTSSIELSYVVDTSEDFVDDITSLTTTYESTTYNFKDITPTNITSTSMKSNFFDFETLVSRADYLNKLKAIPILNRAAIYSMADLIKGTAHEVILNQNLAEGESNKSNDIQLIYTDSSGDNHYVPYYAYFVVELTDQRVLDQLIRRFIMNYLSRGLAVREVLLAYGSLPGVGANEGQNSTRLDSSYTPAKLPTIVNVQNQTEGNYLPAPDSTDLSTPGYNMPDLVIQLVQAQYVSVDITISVVLDYSNDNELTELGLVLLDDIKSYLASSRFTYNSKLTLDDIETQCYSHEFVEYVDIKPFDYSRPGQPVVKGVNYVESSPFELISLGKLTLNLDVKYKSVNDKFTISESQLSNRLTGYLEKLDASDRGKLIVSLSDKVEASDSINVVNTVVLPKLSMSLVNCVTNVGLADIQSTVKSASKVHLVSTNTSHPTTDSSDYVSDNSNTNLNPTSSKPWALISDIPKDPVDKWVIDQSITNGVIS